MPAASSKSCRLFPDTLTHMVQLFTIDLDTLLEHSVVLALTELLFSQTEQGMLSLREKFTLLLILLLWLSYANH
jgi:hypothetical protein